MIVRAGVYDKGGTDVNGWGLTNRVLLGKATTVRSEHNNPEDTIIMGHFHPVTTNGPSAVRPVYMSHSGAILIGFTLTNGATAGLPASRTAVNCGGGIHVSSANYVSNCIIAGNVAQSYSGHGGGGAFQGTYYDCKFLNNGFANTPSHAYGGGAINATLYNCLIAGNTAQKAAGAYRGSLYGCIVSNNLATTAGYGSSSYSEAGGVQGQNAASPVRVYDSLIIGNRADRGGGVGNFAIVAGSRILDNRTPVTSGQGGYGGGAYGANGESSLFNCLIVSNRAGFGGGTYSCYVTNSILAHNIAVYGAGAMLPRHMLGCLVYGNEGNSTYGGGGVYMTSGDRTIESTTIVGNHGPGVLLNLSAAGTLYVRNCIVYGNDHGTNPDYANWYEYTANSTIEFSHCLTTPAKAGWAASNVAADPQFLDPGSDYGEDHVAGNYRLRSMSPALNAGILAGWMTGAVDLDGSPRIDRVTGKVDMGAYERVVVGTMLLVR